MKTCECVTVHRPVLTTTFKWLKVPIDRGGKETKANTVYICPATLQALIELEKIYATHGGKPPWSERRRYPEYARRLAEASFGNQ